MACACARDKGNTRITGGAGSLALYEYASEECKKLDASSKITDPTSCGRCERIGFVPATTPPPYSGVSQRVKRPAIYAVVHVSRQNPFRDGVGDGYEKENKFPRADRRAGAAAAGGRYTIHTRPPLENKSEQARERRQRPLSHPSCPPRRLMSVPGRAGSPSSFRVGGLSAKKAKRKQTQTTIATNFTYCRLDTWG